MEEIITLRAVLGATKSVASYSPCKTYRYSLTRTWSSGNPKLLYLLLNPSTATETKNDPTVVRCQIRAYKLGYQSFRVCNLFAFRSTSPSTLKDCVDPIGPLNDQVIKRSITWADKIICAWGANGALLDRDTEIKSVLKKMGKEYLHLGLTKDNHPMHPLYVPYSRKIVSYTPN